MLSTLPIGAIYHQTLHCLPDAFVLVEILDKGHQSVRIIDVNDKACTLMQYEKQELLSAHSDYHPVAQFFTSLINRDAKGIWKSKAFLKTKYGKRIHIEIESNEINEESSIFQFHRIKEISEEEHQFPTDWAWVKSILDSVHALMVILSPDGKIVEWNTFCEEASGYTLKEVQGNFFWKVLLEEEEHSYFECVYSKENLDHFPLINKNYWILKNGTKKFIKWVNSFVKDKAGNILYVLSTGIDITDQKEMEATIQANENYKKQAEEQQKRFYESISSGILVLNKEGKILFSNRNASTILGYGPDELLNINAFSSIWKTVDENGESLSLKENLFHSMFSTREKIHNLIAGIYNPVKRKHSWLLIDATAIFQNDDPTKPIENVISTFSDITNQVEMQRRMVKSEKLAAIGRLAAAVAHEIRNPLTSISGFLKLISPLLTGKESAYLDIIYDEVDRINRVTSEFLVLAKTQEEKKEALDLGKDILEPMMETFVLQAEKSGITLNVSGCNNQPVFVLCVKNQLLQMFSNLFDNSIEAMPNGGQIKVKVVEGIDTVKVFITDEGYGIPAERLKYIGEPFYSLKEKGTGLGITICNKIIRDHGGELSISSEKHKGTTVEITLPKM